MADSRGEIGTGREILIPAPSAEISDDHYRRYVRVFLLATILLTGALCGWNVWANVWGTYGRSGYLQVYNDRLGKSEYLASSDRLPDAWVLGSSTMYPFLPSSVENRFRLRSFNLASFWAHMDDDWCWLQFLTKDLRTSPKLVILGLETWRFAKVTDGAPLFETVERRLRNSPNLVKHLEQYGRLRDSVSAALDLLNGSHAWTGFDSWLRGKSRATHLPLGEAPSYRIDGSGPYAGPVPDPPFGPAAFNAAWAAGLGQFSAGFASSEMSSDLEGKAKSYFSGKGFDPRQVDRFRRILDRCEERGIRVVLVLLPVHPYFEALLHRWTDHRSLQGSLHGLALEGARAHSCCRVFDARDLRSFGGDPFEFHDYQHMSAANADRLLDRIRDLP